MTTDLNPRASQDSRQNNNNSTTQNAALRGAALAFEKKPPVKPKPNASTYAGREGALAAATRVGRTNAGGDPGAFHQQQQQQERFTTPLKQNHTGDQLRIGYQNTGSSVGVTSPKSGSSSRQSPLRARMSRLDSSGFLQPSTPALDHRGSPSFIAATLAASRSASLSPNPTGQKLVSSQEPRLRAGYARSPSSKMGSSGESSDNVLDLSSIPPTTSLIGLFEQNARGQDKGRHPVSKTTAAPIPIPAPSQRFQERQSVDLRPHTPSPPSKRKGKVSSSARSPSPSVISPRPTRPQTALLSTSPLAEGNIPQLKPKPKTKPKPKPRPKVKSEEMTLPQSPAQLKPKTIESPPTRTQNGSSASSSDSFVSASDHRPIPPPQRKVISSQKSPAQRPTHLHASNSEDSVASANKINSMANAIVASSLASSRAGSPSKSLQPPPPPPIRRPRSHHHLDIFHHKEVSRTPSPSKQTAMRTTMRKPRLEEELDENEKRRAKKHNIMKKHPNKHREGDRKRWRDEVTERERKRYEAVWASNKGLHLPPSEVYETCVSNLVVRDIWQRSRLHGDVLEEVYTLVDRRGDGVLEKEEFVVGMWLLDQRLKGRKLPMRVSEHVWRSVGGLRGLKVRKAGK